MQPDISPLRTSPTSSLSNYVLLPLNQPTILFPTRVWRFWLQQSGPLWLFSRQFSWTLNPLKRWRNWPSEQRSRCSGWNYSDHDNVSTNRKEYSGEIKSLDFCTFSDCLSSNLLAFLPSFCQNSGPYLIGSLCCALAKKCFVSFEGPPVKNWCLWAWIES